MGDERIGTRPATRAFTDTRQFKIMRTLVGAANPLITRLLGSRFAGPLAGSLLLLRYQGRRSGRTYTTPVGYAREGDRIVVVTSPAYSWWRSVVGGADVGVRLDGEWRRARAQLTNPTDPGYDDAVALQVGKRGPRMLRGFGIPVTDDGRVPADARATASTRAHIVRIDLDSHSR